MKFYMAPMEGVTNYIYRNTFNKYYAHIDRYFTPFITPHEKRGFKKSEINELDKEKNDVGELIPQIMTNDADKFIKLALEIKAFGYDEVNLNLGCPSKTVTSKKKGSGALLDKEELDRFLYRIFENSDIKISIKTRIGDSSYEEWTELLRIYSKYPLEELIIHPRLRTDMYNNTPHIKAFDMAVENMSGKIIYNGDLYTREDIKNIISRYPNIHALMLGRGLLKRPYLLDSFYDEKIDLLKLKNFHNELVEKYKSVMFGEINVLFKMKELWYYMIEAFEDYDRDYIIKVSKLIRKSSKLSEYMDIVNKIL